MPLLLVLGECPLLVDFCGCFRICCTLPASSRMICAPMVYLLSCLLHRQCFENRYSRTSAICSSVYVSASERIALRSLMICPLCVSVQPRHSIICACNALQRDWNACSSGVGSGLAAFGSV